MARSPLYFVELHIYSKRGRWHWQVTRENPASRSTQVLEDSKIDYDDVSRELLTDARLALSRWRRSYNS